MLVLTRKSNQSIMIGDEIEISVLSVMGDKVRIGIQAPRSVPVYRREVYVAIQRERDEGLASGGAVAPIAAGRSGAVRASLDAPVTALLEDQVQHAEHHDRDDHGGREQRQREHDEARLALLDRALGAPLGGAALGGSAQRLAAIAVERRLLDKRALEAG